MNDIDTLMARVDEINAKQPPYTKDDIDTIILHQRRQRARKAAGEKPERPKVDLAAIMGTVMSKPKVGPSAFAGRKL